MFNGDLKAAPSDQLQTAYANLNWLGLEEQL